MHSLLLMTHIVAGSVALLTALAILLTRKGTDRHRSMGKLFVVTGRAVVVSATISAIWGVTAVDSFLGDEAFTVSADTRSAVRMFLGLLGVLAILAALDLENGLRAIRGTSATLTDGLGVASSIAGLALAVWGVVSALDGGGSLAWIAVLVGAIGIDAGIKQRRTIATPVSPTEAHLTGMIGASSGFLAAFGLFGLGRLLPIDLFDGDALALAPVIVAVGGGHLLTRWWARRLTRSTATQSVSGAEDRRVLPRE